ncbi:MAG: hypothetical protein H6835_05920 [Planctomycetes bacterium]|nr:hypothetical protein [Planctomycetota bacterium]
MPPHSRPPLHLRLLGLAPTLVALLWIAGVAHFRDMALSGVEWAVVCAAAFAVQTVTARLRPRRPLPPLPEGASPGMVAATAALFVAGLFGLLGGAAEALTPEPAGGNAAWGLRTLWHAACAFAAAYCAFLARLLRAGTPPPPTA